VIEKNSFNSRTRRAKRFTVRIASVLLRPPQANTNTLVCIALFSILGLFILIGMKHGQDLFMDSTEAYAWGMQFLGGYGRHPPLTGWIARLWYGVFPADNWASYALSRVMTCVSLVSIYLIAQRILDQRRAVLVVFAMMLYPLFIGAKSDRFNNYQVLLAILPLTVWLFLRAYEKPTAKSGVALGLAAAAASLTIYSAVFGLVGMALAAVVHPGRRQFFTNPAPYVAATVYLGALSPHIIWLIGANFSSLRWASNFMGHGSDPTQVAIYLGHHFTLLAASLVGAAIALWPWRLQAGRSDGILTGERLLVLIIACVLVAGPAAFALIFNLRLKSDWGNSLFFLVPVALLLLLPKLLVTRAAAAKSATIAAIFTAILLVGAPFYSWMNFKMRPDYGPYTPYSETAAEVTRLWHEMFHSPLQIVVAEFELAAPVVFYSADHPKMFADFDASYSPWIDYPTELVRKGYVGICYDHDLRCQAYLQTLNPNAKRLDVEVSRRRGAVTTTPLKLHLEFTGPNPGKG
jgi:4-amino-4-deoxy-L-arabinose transferase-like glycosyltransferase